MKANRIFAITGLTPSAITAILWAIGIWSGDTRWGWTSAVTILIAIVSWIGYWAVVDDDDY